MMSIGAIAVAKSNPIIVWVGTGEANTRQSSSWGDGVYKSTDGGKTWSRMGLKRHALDRPHRHRSAEPRRRLRRGAGTSVGAERRARRVQDDRRRHDVEEDAVRRREHRRERSRDRSGQSARCCTRRCISASASRGASTAAGRAAASTRPPTPARPGRRLTTGLPTGDMGRIGFDIYKGDRQDDPTIVYAIVEARRRRTRRTRGGGAAGAGGAARPRRCASASQRRRRRQATPVSIAVSTAASTGSICRRSTRGRITTPDSRRSEGPAIVCTSSAPTAASTSRTTAARRSRTLQQRRRARA